MRIETPTRAAIRHALLTWYAQARRELPWRRTHDPYSIWVSEVMLQQTQVKTATPYYQRFITRFPTVQHLAQADVQEVLKAWEGLGYYSRARNLHRAAQLVIDRMDGRIAEEWDALRQLPGIGEYIAAAVLSIAFGRPFAVVDGNVKRVLARLFLVAEPVNHAPAHKIFQNLADLLLDERHPGDYNQALMELGAMVCTPRQPLCSCCPLGQWCRALQTDALEDFPRRLARAKTPEHCLAAGVVYRNGRMLIIQRPAEGLLGGLWEFPAVRFDPAEDPALACIRHLKSAVHLAVEVQKHAVTIRHAYTHFKIRMEVYVCAWRQGRVRLNGQAGFKWIAPDQIGQYALHRAVQKALPHLVRANS